MLEQLLTGAKVGLIVAVPVGPIALLILRRSLAEGKLAGFVSGLGAALADVLCAALASAGLTAVNAVIEAHRTLLHVLGGLFMIAIGIRIWRSPPPANTAARPLHERNLAVACLSTCLLTLTNPMTLLGMVAVVAATSLGAARATFSDSAIFVAGVFLGSAGWWLVLSGAAGWFGQRLSATLLHRINVAAAVAIIAFGVWEVSRFALRYFA